MRKISLLLTSALLGSLWGAPAHAAVFPHLGLERGERAFQAGLLDAGVEVALTDRWSVGASGFYLGVLNGADIDTAYRVLGSADGPSLGLGVSAGYGELNVLGTSKTWFMQPAAIASLPLGPLRLGALFGPVIHTVQPYVTDPGTIFVNWNWIPNLELAYRLDRSNEITLGGNGLIGWRGIY